MRLCNLGGLEVRLVGGSDGNGGGDGPAVVMLHGFGAPPDDLVPLARAFRAPAGTRFAFPGAPLPLDLWPGARAWWLIDLGRYEAVLAGGDPRQLTEDEPPGLAEAREKIDAMLDGLQAELAVAGSRLAIGGFSQGAMLACDVALRSDRPLAGLVLLSTAYICRSIWTRRMQVRRDLPVFQSHGNGDPLLPFVLAEDLRDSMRAAGMNVDWVPFAGGHEIPVPAVMGTSTFLSRVLD
jgi:phospholipase/carboxylesterase